MKFVYYLFLCRCDFYYVYCFCRYVKDKRSIIFSNFNFFGQLLEYEKWIKQEEEELRQRQEFLGSLIDGKITFIIMDFQMCSFFLFIVKVIKFFIFDFQWEFRVQDRDLKRDINDNLSLLVDFDSWNNFQCFGKSILLKMETDFLEKRKFSDFSTLCSGYLYISDSNLVIFSVELFFFFFGVLILNNGFRFDLLQEWKVQKDCKRKFFFFILKSFVSRFFILFLSLVFFFLEGIGVFRDRKRFFGFFMIKLFILMFSLLRFLGKFFIKLFFLLFFFVLSSDILEISDFVNFDLIIKDFFNY